jgi:hypothetical protein
MKTIFYVCVLLAVPFLIHADHGREILNGKWISPLLNKKIDVKVRRSEVKIKGLTTRGWSTFISTGCGVFEDCDGNRIRINNIHDLVYTNRFHGTRIRFTKKGHVHANHSCTTKCSLRNDFFSYSNYDYGYYEERYDKYNTSHFRDGNNDWSDRNEPVLYPDHQFDGRYHVREIDEYVILNKTRTGLKARRGNQNWTEYTQNRFRKNEYIDGKGNKFLVRSDGSLTWRSMDGNVSLNLSK